MNPISPTDTAAHNRIAAAIDALSIDAQGTDAARERLLIAVAASQLALSAPIAFDESMLCLDRNAAESYSFEEAREKAGRRPRPDLLAAGLEKPVAKSKKK